jgi:glycosyltransferase involved in cell wall biosynthesis
MRKAKDLDVKPRTKILYVNHASKISGAERCMLRILVSIDRDRFEPLLICPDGDLANEAEATGTTVFRMPFIDYQSNRSTLRGRSVANPAVALGHAFWLGRAGMRIGKIAGQSGASLIHANTLLARIPAYVAGLFSSTPVIWHIRDILSSRLWLSIYDGVARRGIAGIISVSNACRFQFTDQSRIWTVYDGIPSDSFRRDTEQAEALRASFGWDPKDVVFGIFGRITPWKGHEQFVEAAININTRYPSTRWLVVGEAWSDEEKQFENRLRDMASKSGLSERLIFTGFRKDVSDLMSACDVIVVPSILPDPFPNTVLEGMLCSRVVVAFNTGGIPEAIEDGVSGILVKESTAASLASAMGKLIGGAPLRHEIGLNARNRVVENFSPEKTQRSIENVYDLVLKTKTAKQ